VTKAGLDYLIFTYRKMLTDAGARPVIVDVSCHLSREEMLGHCLWVLEKQIRPLLDRIAGFEEAVRLLGCIQGTVMACGLCTIEKTREHANNAKMTTWDRIMS
jgi:hypothetical protein